MLPRNLTRLIPDTTIQIPLRLIIVGPFVGTTILIAGLIGYLSLRDGQQAADDLAHQLMEKTSAIVIQHLNTYLANAEQINQNTVDAIEQGILDPTNFAQMQPFLWKKLQNNNVSYINYALFRGKYARGITSNGISDKESQKVFRAADYLGMGIQDPIWGITVEEVSSLTYRQSYIYKTNTKGELKELVHIYNYKLWEESWPLETVKANKRIWSSIYSWSSPRTTKDVLSIAASWPIYNKNKNTIGIIAVDLSLENISNYLNELEGKGSEKIKTFIIQYDGVLVANSGTKKPYTRVDDGVKLLKFEDSSDEIINATAQHLPIGRQQPDVQHFDFPHKGERQLVYAERYNKDNLNWFVVVVVPESSFMAQIKANTQKTIILFIVVLVVAIILLVITSRWITEPIIKLSRASKAIDRDNLNELKQKVDKEGFAKRVKEIDDLYESFNMMKGLVGEQVDQLSHRAKHDALTGLPNRTFFMERLEQALEQAQSKPDYLFAVLFIDLDRFKIINDSLGHTVGDRLLITVAKLMQKCLRRTDTIARFGGDEFTILLENLQHINEAISVAGRIHAELMSPLQLENLTIPITASIGIVKGDKGKKHSAEELLRNADNAMYCAKEAGKARYKIFNQEMYERTLERLHLERDLRQAIERQEFLLHYQPIVSLKTGKLVAFEALIRWQHPERGLVFPDKFIPVAENTGLIVEIGECVMHQACQQMRQWQQKFPLAANLKISVNLASPQINDPTLIERIDRVIDRTGLDGSFLQLEITENMQVDDTEATINKLKEITTRKIQLSIDDLGKGHSSLNYSHCFPINTVKIDGSIISKMKSDPNTIKLVGAIITFAHTLTLDVTAEYVETAWEYSQLKTLGCDFGQGYFFSKPLDSEAAKSLILSDRQW